MQIPVSIMTSASLLNFLRCGGVGTMRHHGKIRGFAPPPLDKPKPNADNVRQRNAQYGGSPMRLLKALAVMLTLAAAVPHVRCVCPDGQVKFFCLGLSTSSTCCCVSSSCQAPDRQDTATCHVTSSDEHGSSCCDRLQRVPVQPSEEFTTLKAPCGCQQSLSSVAEAVLSSSPDVIDLVLDHTFTPSSWTIQPVVSRNAYFPGRTTPRFVLQPADLVVVFCHFNC